MPAVTATGLSKVTCCQPLAVSPVNVARASSAPLLRPEAPDVRAGVRRALVEAHPGDVAGDVGRELHAELDGLSCRVVEAAAGAADAFQMLHGQPTSMTVTPAPAISRLPLSSTARDLIVRRCRSRRRSTCRSSSPGRSRDATWRRRRSTPRRRRRRRRRCRRRCRVIVDRRCRSGPSAPAAGEVIVDVGAVSSRVDAVAGDEIALERRRLDAHVGEQVDRRLLHPRVGGSRRRFGDVRRARRRAPTPTARCRRRRRARRSRRGRASGSASRCRARRCCRGRAMCLSTSIVVDESRMSPAGRKPLSTSSSHSWPSDAGRERRGLVRAASEATVVLRQKPQLARTRPARVIGSSR